MAVDSTSVMFQLIVDRTIPDRIRAEKAAGQFAARFDPNAAVPADSCRYCSYFPPGRSFGEMLLDVAIGQCDLVRTFPANLVHKSAMAAQSSIGSARVKHTRSVATNAAGHLVGGFGKEV
jgi:hypothetical protein